MLLKSPIWTLACLGIFQNNGLNMGNFHLEKPLSCAPYSRHPRVRNGGTGTQTPHYAQPDPNPWTCSDPKYFDFWSSRLVSRTDFVKWAFFWEFKISEIFGTKMAITRSFFDLLSWNFDMLWRSIGPRDWKKNFEKSKIFLTDFDFECFWHFGPKWVFATPQLENQGYQ